MMVETATGTPRSSVSLEIRARGHTLVQDKPAPTGEDVGMMASELLLAALMACQHSTFVKVAHKRRVDARVVSLEGELLFEEDAIREVRIHFVLEAPVATTDGQILQVCRLTDKSCTISKALAVGVNWSYSRASSSA